MNYKIVLFAGLLLSFTTMVLFQNCGGTSLTSSQKVLSGGIEKLPGANQTAPINEVVIDQTSGYNKITWTEQDKIFDRTGQHQTHLDVDLDTGSMSLQKTIGSYNTLKIESSVACSIEDQRLKDLNNLLKTSRICRVNTEINPGITNCMAIGESDIQLTNASTKESMELRTNICNSGIFLCEGLDVELRNILKDLVLSPPTQCRAN